MTNPIQELIKRQDEEFNSRFPKILVSDELSEGYDGKEYLKQFLSRCRQELLDEVVKMGKQIQKKHDVRLPTLYHDGYYNGIYDLLSQLTKLKE